MLTIKQERSPTLLVKKIGLISDTHIPTRAQKIPLLVFDVFQQVDFIIHAGDLVSLDVIEELGQLAPVVAVRGNMDKGNIRRQLPETNELMLDRWRVGVTHDPGALYGWRIMRKFATEQNYDVLVYGHTHRPSIHWEGQRLFINPGSPTQPLPPFITQPTIAILKLSQHQVKPEIIALKK
jgi:putative phosphoesterase